MQSEPKSLPEPDSRTVGDFRPDGSWNASAQLRHRGHRYQFVSGLVRARRAAHLSPAQIADQIEASACAEMFGELSQWKTLTRWDDWAFAWTRTSADETIKRCGVGSRERFHWQNGTFCAGEDERPHIHADGQNIADFVGNVLGRMGVGG